MQLFFQEHITKENEQVTFAKDESKHIVRVLRKQVGDRLYVTNGNGWLFEVEISTANHNKCTATISNATYTKPSQKKLHVFIAPTKTNDRFELFLEKATEIGITEITPILCDHSERKVIKKDRFERILQSAMKQSLQYHLPKLNDLTPLSSILSKHQDGEKFIAHCEDDMTRHQLFDAISSNHINVLIGPEGDFSTEEIDQALANNWLPVSLGSNRLRTETAGLIAVSTFNLKPIV